MAHGQRHGGVAVTLAGAAVLAAVIGARAAVLFDHSSSGLQSSIRTEVKRGAALVEDVRFVYEAEAQQAYRVAKATALADAARRAAASHTGIARETLLIEADASTRLAEALRPSSQIAKNPRYATKDGAYDIGRRLSDVRAEYPDLVALDPDGKQRRANREAWHGNLDAAATLGAAIAFLLGALAQAFAPTRRVLLRLAWVFLAGGIAATVAFEFALP
jgi:hypothetical protein